MPYERIASLEVAGKSEMTNFVAYYRVSTEKQGRSGLGLEAQECAVNAFIASRPGAKLVAPPFVEIESGKRNDRPELLKALLRAKVTGSTLLVAKLDRLSRNACFLMTLRDAGVPFVAADVPEANTMTIGILALVAQNEREAISARTKAALQAVKPRIAINGQKKHPEVKRLGSPKGAVHLKGKGYDAIAREAQRSRADARAHDLIEVFTDLEKSGFVSANSQAKELNNRGIVTARGGKWSATSALNVKARLPKF
jgi:DNA invertase Pin-like site-specific DNA recombinase